MWLWVFQTTLNGLKTHIVSLWWIPAEIKGVAVPWSLSLEPNPFLHEPSVFPPDLQEYSQGSFKTFTYLLFLPMLSRECGNEPRVPLKEATGHGYLGPFPAEHQQVLDSEPFGSWRVPSAQPGLGRTSKLEGPDSWLWRPHPGSGPSIGT